MTTKPKRGRLDFRSCFILLLLHSSTVVVQGLFFSGHCNGGTCNDTAPSTSCSDLILLHDVQGDDCCFSFMDTPVGGCDLIVTAASSNKLNALAATASSSGNHHHNNAFCSIKERSYDCRVQVEPTMQYSCLVHGAAYTPSFENSGAGCHVVKDDEHDDTDKAPRTMANYDTTTSPSPSEHEIIAASKITLSGVSNMNHQQAMEFEKIVADHMQEYFASSSPNATINDLISYVRVYIGQNETEYLIGDQFSNELSIVFLQFFTWRWQHQHQHQHQHGEGKHHHNHNITATSLRDEALTSEIGKQMFLDRLQQQQQGSTTDDSFWSDVTDISNVVTLESSSSSVHNDVVPNNSVPNATMISSFAKGDVVEGDANQEDCYSISRYMEDTIYDNDCTTTFLSYTYCNGGINAEGIDTGIPKEIYYKAEVDVLHGCNDQDFYPDRCSISIVDLGLGCDDCSYDDEEGTITMGPACSDTLSDVFNPYQTVKLFFDGWESSYEEEFFTLTFNNDWDKHDTMCAHPAVDVIMRSSFANMDVVAGDQNLGHCYYVDRTMYDTIYNNGCSEVTLRYNYHIVGMEHDPLKSYNVTVNAIHGCHPASGIADSCSIVVEGMEGSCSNCFYDGNSGITIEDCSDVFEDLFAAGPQTVKKMFDGMSPPYEQQFLILGYESQDCLDPSLFLPGMPTPSPPSSSSSSQPTSAPYFSLSPSQGPSNAQVSSFASGDIVEGDAGVGDCYLVDRYMEDTIHSDGCIRSYLWFTYYNGGLNANYDDTGHPQMTYHDVEVTTWHSCDDQEANPDSCTISVHGVNATCHNCFRLDRYRITMGDCTGSLGDVFPPENQTVELFFDGRNPNPSYEELFFSLTYDEDRCLHPAIGVEVTPMPTPAPSN